MITREDLRSVSLLAELPPEQVDAIAARAADLILDPGDWLIREGELAAFFFLLRGRLAVFKSVAGVDRQIGTYDPGVYLGEVPLLLNSPAIASLRAEEPSRVARLEADAFHELILCSQRLSDQLFATMVQRITRAREVTAAIPRTAITLVGERWDSACHEVRNFLARNRVVHTWIDLADPDAGARVPGGLPADVACPLLVFPDGSRLTTPTLREVAERIGLRTSLSVAAADGAYDVAIVGGGPAGLAAAVYGASEGLKTMLIERLAPGGQAGSSSRIENYLGFPTGLSGDELSARAWRQAERFGTEIVLTREAVGLAPAGGTGADGTVHLVRLDGDECVGARAVVLALGVSWRRLDAEGIDRLVGRGVYYGAARTEAQGVRGKHIHLLGGGNSAGQTAVWFASYARQVTMLVRGPSLAASMSQYLIDQLKTKRNVELRFNTEVAAVEGNDHVEQVTLLDRVQGTRSTEPTGGVFILIGADAETGWLPPAIVRDTPGYVCTGRDMLQVLETRARQPLSAEGAAWTLPRDPYLLETSVPGIFAAGDVRHGSIKRVASGVGEGSMTIAFVHQYLAG
ncbi:MAG TPA: FAD-dependent oxidoreductase [Gemmatimonadales bacterium]|nr:FAD-dependent oxidoreductase [Gemmatimonadales bacterium]